MQRKWIIYTLSDPRTGEVRYVGRTFRGRQRLVEHLSKAKRGGRTYRDCWIKSLLVLGLRPSMTVLQEGFGEGWQDAERDWIAKYRESGRLVNLTDGGEGFPGYVPSAELRQLWSRQRKGVKYPPGRFSGMLGRHHTPEVCEKIRESSFGRRHTQETKSKISSKHMGKTISEEQRRRLRELRLGTSLTEEHKRKIAEATTTRKSVVCLETGSIYPSITAAAKALGVTDTSVNQAIRKGCRCKGNHYRFA